MHSATRRQRIRSITSSFKLTKRCDATTVKTPTLLLLSRHCLFVNLNLTRRMNFIPSTRKSRFQSHILNADISTPFQHASNTGYLQTEFRNRIHYLNVSHGSISLSLNTKLTIQLPTMKSGQMLNIAKTLQKTTTTPNPIATALNSLQKILPATSNLAHPSPPGARTSSSYSSPSSNATQRKTLSPGLSAFSPCTRSPDPCPAPQHANS